LSPNRTSSDVATRPEEEGASAARVPPAGSRPPGVPSRAERVRPPRTHPLAIRTRLELPGRLRNGSPGLVLEQQQGKLAQAASPALELVGRQRRDEERRINARCLQLSDAGLRVAAEAARGARAGSAFASWRPRRVPGLAAARPAESVTKVVPLTYAALPEAMAWVLAAKQALREADWRLRGMPSRPRGLELANKYFHVDGRHSRDAS
jgi:hypothetical protein